VSQSVADVHLVDAVVQPKTSAASTLATLATRVVVVAVAVCSVDYSPVAATFVAWHYWVVSRQQLQYQSTMTTARLTQLLPN